MISLGTDYQSLLRRCPRAFPASVASFGYLDECLSTGGMPKRNIAQTRIPALAVLPQTCVRVNGVAQTKCPAVTPFPITAACCVPQTTIWLLPKRERLTELAIVPADHSETSAGCILPCNNPSAATAFTIY
jgi:hypothetical protein